MSKHRENTTRKINAMKTKDLLYQSTLDLINEKGYENVSIADITTRANCATGTFYLHFKSKNDVMAYCIEQYNHVADEAYEAAKDVEGFEDRFITFIVEDFKRTASMGKGTIRALYGANIMQSKLVMNNDDRSVYRYFKNIFQYGIEKGTLDSGIDTEKCSRFLGRALIGVDLEWSCTKEEINISDYARDAAYRILHGFI